MMKRIALKKKKKIYTNPFMGTDDVIRNMDGSRFYENQRFLLTSSQMDNPGMKYTPTLVEQSPLTEDRRLQNRPNYPQDEGTQLYRKRRRRFVNRRIKFNENRNLK